MAKTDSTLDRCTSQARGLFPGPSDALLTRDTALYLAHTGEGHSMRALARASGAAPSSVMRAVHRVEARRDDPLFDGIIAQADLGAARGVEQGAEPAPEASGDGQASMPPRPSDEDVHAAAKRFLRRLSEPGAFLLVKPDARRGGIFCAANGHAKPIAMIERAIAAEFLRRDWIKLAARGTASLRYRVTDAGRSALKRLLAEQAAERAAPGFAEAQAPFRAQHRLEGERIFTDGETGAGRPITVNLGESPLGWLAKRKAPDGTPFLDPVEVEAGERLREDFEAAQIGPSVAQDWRRFLAPAGPRCGPGQGGAEGAMGARDRVSKALGALGPGLADAVLRVCCFLEGLEACERRMGWSARSGKVVLKIALQRLAEHYGLGVLRN